MFQLPNRSVFSQSNPEIWSEGFFLLGSLWFNNLSKSIIKRGNQTSSSCRSSLHGPKRKAATGRVSSICEHCGSDVFLDQKISLMGYIVVYNSQLNDTNSKWCLGRRSLTELKVHEGMQRRVNYSTLSDNNSWNALNIRA